MVRRHALSLFAMALAASLGTATNVAAQGEKDKDRATTDQKSMPANSETIRGLIAGVTAEGEIYYNHQTNAAVKTEGAFLTVVAAPMSMKMDKVKVQEKEASRERHHAAGNAQANAQQGNAQGQANAQANARHEEHEAHHHHGDHARHNVYIVWLTPKTKVCAAAVPGVKAAESSAKTEAEKKEIAFDQLEVGDQVEIQFAAFEDSEAHKHVHQSRHMQTKHGRHRTHVGYATAITIMSTPEHSQNGSDSDKKSSDSDKKSSDGSK